MGATDMDRGFAVVDLGETEHIEEGATAPDFTRPLVNPEYWEDESLTALLEDGPVLLVFHTMDGDFPATYIWREISPREWDELVQVIGVSISSPYEHKHLIRDRGIEDRGYRLFSDPKNGIAEQFGIVHDLDGMTGLEEPRPAVFLIDEDRTVQYAWVATKWPSYPDYDEVEHELEQIAD